MRNRLLFGLSVFLVVHSTNAHATFMEVFAKGSASKNFLSTSSYVLSVSAAAGVAFTLFSGIRLEGRYTNASSLQNQLDVSSGALSGTLSDIMTQTSIYSVGIDLDLMGPQSSFQPYLYVGVGYVRTERSYYYMDSGSSVSTFIPEPPINRISGNLGLGFRLRLANALAFEAEAFGYAMDINKNNANNALINLFGSVGIRLFI